MKTILFPTDHSECAENALDYAIGIAEKWNARIILHNSCHVPRYNEMVPYENISEEQVFMDATSEMKEAIDKHASRFKNIPIESHVSLGLAGDDIVSVAKEKRADLIVMGTKGASGIEKVLIGSIAAGVIEKADCPVMVVPDEAGYKDFRKIVFATDYSDYDIPYLSFLSELSIPFEAEIVVVHVSAVTATDTLERDRFKNFKEEVLKKIHYEKISFQLVVGLDLAKDLDSIVQEQKADLLAMSLRKRNFITRFFSPSLTKRMSYHSRIPIISCHS